MKRMNMIIHENYNEKKEKLYQSKKALVEAGRDSWGDIDYETTEAEIIQFEMENQFNGSIPDHEYYLTQSRSRLEDLKVSLKEGTWRA